MADGGSNSDNSWESWLGGWVQSAKEKSSTALEFVKKDLAEFTCTIQKETEKAVEKTSSSLTKANTEEATNKFKAGISSFFDNISKALVIPPEDDYIPMKVSADGTSLYDRGKARLHALQLDAATYMDPPQGPLEQYSMWLESFDMDQHKGEISELLVSKVEVRALYTKLVPNEVSHADFWQRYFYKVHQLQCDEARKQALMRRADQTKGDSLSWDDDWSGGEEEDDGNQSDWEKMPRPSQVASAEEVKQSTLLQSSSPPLTPPEEKTKEPAEPESQVSKEEFVMEAPPSAQSERPDSAVSNDQSNNTNTLPVSANPHQTECPLSEEKAQGAMAKKDNESGSFPSQPTPDLWSLHIPSETACASHPENIIEGTERHESAQPGSSSDAHHAESNREVRDATQKTEAPCGAAAASMEVPSPNSVVENLSADGACGAADMVGPSPPQLSASPPSNLDIPAASSSSSSSVLETAKMPEQRLSETPEANDGAIHNLASSPSKEISQSSDENKSQGKEESASGQPKVTEDLPGTDAVGDGGSSEIKMRVKGDMVVIGERDSPSTDSSDTKDLALDEDWEDFDVEVTEEDLKAAEDIAKKLGENLDAEDDDWENWE